MTERLDVSDLTLQDVLDAQGRTKGHAIRTPLVRLQAEGRQDIYLKFENLQPVGSFKIRCAANALVRRLEIAREGVSTASAGNFAQGLAYAGRALGVPVATYVPETAAKSKVDALRRLGATIMPVSYDAWWAMLAAPSNDPRFIHPVADIDVLAGNGVIALELLEDLPDVATIIAPYGGGGLSVGIAAATRAAGSSARVIACETQAGAPLRAAIAAGEPVDIVFDPNTFITGMGGPTVIPCMWPLAKALIADTALVSLAQTADALRMLIERHHLIVEGAGAAALAAALATDYEGPVVCILSGGHLDVDHLITILQGVTP